MVKKFFILQECELPWQPPLVNAEVRLIRQPCTHQFSGPVFVVKWAHMWSPFQGG